MSEKSSIFAEFSEETSEAERQPSAGDISRPNAALEGSALAASPADSIPPPSFPPLSEFITTSTDTPAGTGDALRLQRLSAVASLFPPDTPSPQTLLGAGPHAAAANPLGLLPPGSQFGVFQIGKCIGKGGMARIYQAEHAGLRRQVALKVLIDGFARDPDGRERFVREARIAAAIKHPNVVNIFDVGVQDEAPYLVMELLEGTDLESLLETRGALDEGLIIDIMVPVVAGLAAVHDAGIVHRDLKPGNIFLARGRYEDLEPKLLDFGISKAPGAEQLKLTTSGMLMGTPFYMSPEGLRGEDMTPLSDQYSLGVVMYECASGATPFAAGSFAEVFKLITAGQFKPVALRNSALSKRFARIITRAMSLEPDKRYKDLRELGRELLLLAGQRTRITWGLSFEEVRETVTLSSRSHPRSEQAVKHAARARRKTWAWALLALLPLLFVALFALGQRWKDEAPRSSAPAAPAAVTSPQGTRRDTASSLPALAAPELSPSPSPLAVEPVPVISKTRHRVSSNRAAANPAPQPEPEWTAPTPPQSRPARSPSGANGAPIFD